LRGAQTADVHNVVVMSINVHAQTRHGLLAIMCACVVLFVGMVAAINLAIPMLAASHGQRVTS
jgi:hypothetical protein